MSNNLPDYIRNRQAGGTSLAQRGLQNIGAGAGPYLAIGPGSKFAWVDAAGNRKPLETTYVDVVIIDINDHLSKIYYRDDYNPNEVVPPTCFSDNSMAPSVAAKEPQSATCQTCQWAVWGSKINQLGNAVPACQDRQKTAVMAPGMPNNIFLFSVPPASLKPWRAYLAKFQNAGFSIEDVITRVSYDSQDANVLTFNPAPSPWLDQATLTARDTAISAKAADQIVGRLDRPRGGASVTISPNAVSLSTGQPVHASPLPVSVPTTVASSPTESTPRGRGRRRQTAAPETPAPVAAPFMSQGQPAQPNGPAFGISQGVAPNPELEGALKQFFG